MIEFTEEQLECQEKVLNWASDPSLGQVFVVNGYAGTGKSSIVKQTMDRLNRRTQYVAFTAKAALVMQAKGCTDASTIHKLIYTPGGNRGKGDLDSKVKLLATLPEGGLEAQQLARQIQQIQAGANSPIFRLNLDSQINQADYVVVDEHSMLGANLGKDLLSFGTRMIALGDPCQLPPVGDEGYFTHYPADYTLTQIHRQALDSPILALATKARLREPLQIGQYGNCSVIGRDDLTAEMAMSADQILCGRNKTRHLNNARMRQLKGFAGPLPEPGEKLICKKNNHERGLLNGSLWKVVRANKYSRSKISLTVVPEEGGEPITCLVHEQYFTGYGDLTARDPKKGWAQEQIEREQSIGFEMKEAESLTFGYVITVHASQGSEWPSVLVLDESSSFGVHANKHLYTAITRASEKVVIRL